MNEEARRYTLDEAAVEFARRQCANHGHSWDILENIANGPLRIVCSTCGWGGTVEMGKRP